MARLENLQAKIEQFGSRKLKGIRQEFLAQIARFNLLSCIKREAQKIIDKQKKKRGSKRKYKYKINWAMLNRIMREQLPKFLRLKLKKSDILEIIKRISRSLIPEIKGRIMPRLNHHCPTRDYKPNLVYK